MSIIHRSLRLVGLATILAGLLIGTSASLASAATTHTGAAGSASTVNLPSKPKPTTSHVPNLTPKGCNSGNFCSYNAGNGGHLCFQTNKNIGAWSDACANHNDSAYNRNGNSVNLYYFAAYGGAYATLYSGNYFLYMNQNHFNECTASCDGLGEAMQNNVASSKFN